MAQRQAPQTAPVLDNTETYETETSKIVHALRPVQLNSILRIAQKAALDNVKTIESITKEGLDRLGFLRDETKSWRREAKGSEQFDPGSFKVWVDGITEDDEDSIDQLIAIDATAQARLK